MGSPFFDGLFACNKAINKNVSNLKVCKYGGFDSILWKKKEIEIVNDLQD